MGNSPGVRLDLLLLECLRTVVKTSIEPRCGNVPLWDAGVREIAAAKLKEMGVSSQPVTMVQAARGLGILGPDPDVVVVKANPGKGRSRRGAS